MGSSNAPTRWYPSLASAIPWDVREAHRRAFDFLYNLQDSVAALQQSAAAVTPGPSITQIKAALEASGTSPLNVTGLVGTAPSTPSAPVIGTGLFLLDTHANRLAHYPATSYPAGTAFYETDRQVLYLDIAGVWYYAAGVMQAATASRPTDLGTTDKGFLFIDTTLSALEEWTGSAWTTLITGATVTSVVGTANQITVNTVAGVATISLPVKVQINGAAVTEVLNLQGAIKLLGGPASASAGQYLILGGGYGSPVTGRIYVGDGSGWRIAFSKRTSSTDTDLITIDDSGNLKLLTGTAQIGGVAVATVPPAWTAYTPTWGISSGSPTISSYVARYSQFGKVVSLRVNVVFTVPSSSPFFTISLPFAAFDNTQTISGVMTANSGAINVTIPVFFVGAGLDAVYSWATGTTYNLSLQGVYEST